MNKVKDFINKYWYLIIPALILILIIGNRIFPETEQTDTENALNYEEIVPGRSTTEDIIDKIGSPNGTVIHNNYQILEYESAINNYPSRIYVIDNTAQIIIEPLSPESKANLNYYNNKYGDPDYTIFDNEYGPAYMGKVYEDPGIVVFAHRMSGEVLEIWTINPESFRETARIIDKTITDKIEQEPTVYTRTPEPN